MFKNLGISLFFTGLVLFLIGTKGSAQFVSQNGNTVVDLLEIGAVTGIITAMLVAVLTFRGKREIDTHGALFMGVGAFMFIQSSAMGFNQYFDTQEANIRTFLVNNVDSRGGPKGTDYYAMIQSWWDRTRYIPLGVSKSLHDQLVPKKTYIDVAIHQGALNLPYFGAVTVSTNESPQESMKEFYEDK